MVFEIFALNYDKGNPRQTRVFSRRRTDLQDASFEVDSGCARRHRTRAQCIAGSLYLARASCRTSVKTSGSANTIFNTRLSATLSSFLICQTSFMFLRQRLHPSFEVVQRAHDGPKSAPRVRPPGGSLALHFHTSLPCLVPRPGEKIKLNPMYPQSKKPAVQ